MSGSWRAYILLFRDIEDLVEGLPGVILPDWIFLLVSNMVVGGYEDANRVLSCRLSARWISIPGQDAFPDLKGEEPFWWNGLFSGYRWIRITISRRGDLGLMIKIKNLTNGLSSASRYKRWSQADASWLKELYKELTKSHAS